MWRRRLTGLGLIAVALAAVFIAFVFQYQNVYAKTMWHRFVKEAIPEVLAAEGKIQAGQAALRNAKEAKLDDPVVEELEANLVTVTTLFQELATVDAYIQPIEADGTPIEMELSEVGVGEEDTSLASLDIFSEASSGTMYKVLDPPGVSGLLNRYEHVEAEMLALLEEVAVDAEAVNESLEDHLTDALGRMRAEAEFLRETAVRASLFLNYVEDRAGETELWLDLEKELGEASKLLEQVQNVDRSDLPAMVELTEAMKKLTKAIDKAATALAESLGETYEEVLQQIPPEEMWQGGLDWIGDEAIAPIPQFPSPEPEGSTPPAGGGENTTPPPNPGEEEGTGPGETVPPTGGGDDGDDDEDEGIIF